MLGPNSAQVVSGTLVVWFAPARHTEQRISAHLGKWALNYASHPTKAKWWREFLCLPSVSLALRSMRACGLLSAILPEWERVEHLVVRDFYHRYTVDEHTLVTLHNVGSLPGAQDPPNSSYANGRPPKSHAPRK